jgi:hypothetical protein
VLSAAAWSAIAASFSALAALLTYGIHRRNLLDAARPELVLDAWTRESTRTGLDGVKIGKIKNIGRGPAFHPVVRCWHQSNQRPTAVMSSVRLSVLGPGESVDLQGEITIIWQNFEPWSGTRIAGLKVVILAWDARGYRHETTYRLSVFETSDQTIAGTTMVAPGVSILHRVSKSRPVWLLKTIGILKRTPVLRRLFARQDR